MKFVPRLHVQESTDLIRLGTNYGGWTFENSPDLEGATIVSCGLGEDASFDVEFVSRFKGKVIIVDPTPRAMSHFESIRQRLGAPAIESYTRGGKQNPEAYDLQRVNGNSLVLEPRAIWIESTKVKFFAPGNPSHVSYSIVRTEGNADCSLQVESITPKDLLAKFNLVNLPLIKLDIEGAELPVIEHMLDNAIHPRQILVEIDDLRLPSARGKANVEHIDARLREAGYRCCYFDGVANTVYTQ
jgi:FkbM family methyltransferase